MTETELTDEQATALAALSDEDRAALSALTVDERAALAPPAAAAPVKKAAAKKQAAPRQDAPAKDTPATVPVVADVEPPHPPVHEEAHLAQGYHAPTIPATIADEDHRTGFKVADPEQQATHIAFEDGSTHSIDAETGRIADKV